MNENELKKPWLSSAEDDDVFSDILESRHLVVFPWLIEIILGLRPASVLVVVTHPCFRGKLFIVQNPIQERGLLAEWCLLRCGGR